MKELTRTFWVDKFTPAFVLVATPRSETWVDFQVFRGAGVDDEDNALFVAVERSDMVTADRDEADLVMEGHVKWDGCCEMMTDLHICDHETALVLARVISALHPIAKELMGADKVDW